MPLYKKKNIFLLLILKPQSLKTMIIGHFKVSQYIVTDRWSYPDKSPPRSVKSNLRCMIISLCLSDDFKGDNVCDFLFPSLDKETLSKTCILTHCTLVDSSTVICWTGTFVILWVWGLLCRYILFLWKILLANNVDSDQTPRYVASDLGLHCLPMTLLQVSR